MSRRQSGDLTPIGKIVHPQQLPKPAGNREAQSVLPGFPERSHPDPSPKVPVHSPTRAQNRLLDAVDEIYGGDPAQLRYLHIVLAQCGLPYREPEAGVQFYEKRNGRTSLILTPGVLLDPKGWHVGSSGKVAQLLRTNL